MYLLNHFCVQLSVDRMDRTNYNMKRLASGQEQRPEKKIKRTVEETKKTPREYLVFWVFHDELTRIVRRGQRVQEPHVLIPYRCWSTAQEWTNRKRYRMDRLDSGEVRKVLDYPVTQFIKAFQDDTELVLQCYLFQPGAERSEEKGRKAAGELGIGFQVEDEWTVIPEPHPTEKIVPYHVRIIALSWKPADKDWTLLNRDTLLAARTSNRLQYKQSVQELVVGLHRVHQQTGWLHGSIDAAHIVVAPRAAEQVHFLVVGFEQARKIDSSARRISIADSWLREWLVAAAPPTESVSKRWWWSSASTEPEKEDQKNTMLSPMEIDELQTVIQLLWTDVEHAPSVLPQARLLNLPFDLACIQPKIDQLALHMNQLLGSGSYGSAYLLCDHDVKKCNTVLKLTVLFEPSDEIKAKQEFELAQLAADVKLGPAVYKPWTCPVQDATNRQLSCMAMQYIQGPTLHRVLEEKLYPSVQLSRIFEHLFKRLVDFHVRGAIHNDLHAANILIDRFNNAWVVDYGLALVAAQLSDDKSAISPINPLLAHQPPIQSQPWFIQTFPSLVKYLAQVARWGSPAFADAANADLLWLAISFQLATPPRTASPSAAPVPFILAPVKQTVTIDAERSEEFQGLPLSDVKTSTSGMGWKVHKQLARNLVDAIRGRAWYYKLDTKDEGWTLEYKASRHQLTLTMSMPSDSILAQVKRLSQQLGLGAPRFVWTAGS